MLDEEIVTLLSKEDSVVSKVFLERVKKGLLTRDENIASHFCLYFLPFNSETKEVFMVHHKKANMWLAPGGHIDRGESLFNALSREMKEELGLDKFYDNLPVPFFFSVTPINNYKQPCKEHLDIWFVISTDGKNFNVDTGEFNKAQWMSIENALNIVVDPANREVLTMLQNN